MQWVCAPPAYTVTECVPRLLNRTLNDMPVPDCGMASVVATNVMGSLDAAARIVALWLSMTDWFAGVQLTVAGGTVTGGIGVEPRTTFTVH